MWRIEQKWWEKGERNSVLIAGGGVNEVKEGIEGINGDGKNK